MFPGCICGLAPALVSQALLTCPAPLGILRAGDPGCEGPLVPRSAELENVMSRQDLRPWRQAIRRADSQVQKQ